MAVRQIRDMCLTHKWQQMVFAQGIEVQVPAKDDFLIMLFGEERAVDGLFGILRIPAGQVFVGLHDPAGCPRQPFPLGIFADMAKDAPHCIFSRAAVSSVCS